MTSLIRIAELERMTNDQLMQQVIELEAGLVAQTHRADVAEAGFRRCMEPDAARTKAVALEIAKS